MSSETCGNRAWAAVFPLGYRPGEIPQLHQTDSLKVIDNTMVRDGTVEVWEWICNVTPHFIMDVITYPESLETPSWVKSWPWSPICLSCKLFHSTETKFGLRRGQNQKEARVSVLTMKIPHYLMNINLLDNLTNVHIWNGKDVVI